MANNVLFKIFFFVYIGCMWQYSDAFESNNYSYENNSFHSNATFVSLNQTEPLLLNILVVSNDSSLRQDNYSLMLNNSADNLAENRFEFQLHNSSKYVKSSNLAEHFSEAISTKLAGLFREWMKSFLSLKISVHKNRYNGKSESTSINIVSSGPSFVDLESSEISGVTTTTENPKSDYKKTAPAQGRQFLLHPYLPYGKEIKPDEKISIHDVLPVKIVKFVKSMVEDAPWEQMFMKMVRMVVDQFVDKIIEQMFAHKDADEDKWRSFDGGDKSPWLVLKDKMFSLRRSRRSSGKNKFEKETASGDNPSTSHKSEKDVSWTSNSFAAVNRISKDDSPKMKTEPEPTWLDSLLDYLFPEEGENSKSGFYEWNERKKRDADYRSPAKNLRMEDILKTFLKKYLELSGQEKIVGNSIDVAQEDVVEESSTEQSEMEDVTESSSEQTELEDLNESSTEQPELGDLNDSSTEQPELGDLNEAFDETSKTIPPYLQNPRFDNVKYLMRRKRSTDMDSQKEAKQANFKGRPQSHRSTRDECSLRRACNAGRLLARLPSVPDLTLQLKEYGNEPHWDALLWGMAKKRCSKIYCKRERSPKGSKHHWHSPEKRFYKKHSPLARIRDSKSDLTTIFPI